MMLSGFHSLAALTFERLLYSITAGTALVIIVSLGLRLLPARNSHTRFAIWFSALLAVAALPFAPFISVPWQLPKSTASGHALLTMPASWAEYIVLAWSFVAAFGLARVIHGLWQLRRLRRHALPLDMSAMAPEIRDVIADRSGLRPVLFLVSERVEVPAAIGFIQPAIILPAWLVAESAGGNCRRQDLKYVLLHELAHLRRWDDWTNLAQKVVKSILFFHPGVLWVERKLALDREMACDDAVLSQTGSPQSYAQCLADLAEKSFLRRHIALAQAAVSRMTQLSRRVAWILNHQSLHNTRIWKPAIPMVAAAAVLCAISASTTTELVGFSDAMPLHAVAPPMPQPVHGGERAPAAAVVNSSADSVAPAGIHRSADVRPVPVDLKYGTGQSNWKPQRSKASVPSPRRAVIQRAASRSPQHLAGDQVRLIMSSYSLTPPASESSVDKKIQAQPPGQLVLLVVTTRSFSSDKNPGWQVSAWEFYLYVPAKQIPRKT